MKHALEALAVMIALAPAAACNPTLAPPIRSTHYGAPGRMAGHRVEIRGAGTMYGSGGAWGGVRVTDNLRLELGTDLRFVDNENWALGGAGLRYTFDLRGPTRWGVALDLELGVGLGVGGVVDSTATSDSRSWTRRLAGGGLLGVGFAGYLSEHFALFLRSRGQLTRADGVPITLWGSAIGGFEIAGGPVAWYVAGGVAGYRNDADSEVGPTAETGISIRLF